MSEEDIVVQRVKLLLGTHTSHVWGPIQELATLLYFQFSGNKQMTPTHVRDADSYMKDPEFQVSSLNLTGLAAVEISGVNQQMESISLSFSFTVIPSFG